jgi:PAS domain S-box-containing protein
MAQWWRTLIEKEHVMKTTEQDIEYARFSHLLLDSMADGVFTVDKKGSITSWNKSMERITGYHADEIIGKNCRVIGFDRCFGKTCPTGVKECNIFNKGNLDGKECFLKHKSGIDIPVVKSARVFTDSHNAVIGVVETVTDMSELYKARHEAEVLHRKLGDVHRFDTIIGAGDAMMKMFVSIEAAAGSDVTALLQGESGTGKERVAGAIHFNSRRKDGAFITVNCSALSESLLESELFGHVKGSFTGAIRDRIGRFEEAEGGTLFLDEIGEISPFIQVKLLRVLQEREVERVGDSKKRKVDIRIIAATNKDLFTLVKEGQFREDLYYRLKVFPIHIPPLRERKNDIPLLVRHFMDIQNVKTGKNVAGLSPSAMRSLLDYNWPGNVRELENAIEHAFVLCAGDHIELIDLPVEIREDGHIQEQKNHDTGIASPVIKGKGKITCAMLTDVLSASEWNKAEAGRRLGLSRASIWKYMKKWDIPMESPVKDFTDS